MTRLRIKSTLTRRNREVLELVARGHSTQEVADRLLISKRTADYHLDIVYRTLKVGNRVQAIREARRRKLIPRDDFVAVPRDGDRKVGMA